MAAYSEATDAIPKLAKTGIGLGTWRWLCVKYLGECVDFRRLDPRTRHVRRLILESTFDEPIAPGSPKFFGDMPLAKMTADAVSTLRDRKMDFPEAANSRVKAVRQVFKFGVNKKLMTLNPARDVPYIQTGSTGYHTWTLEEVRQFEKRHPIGTKARLALALLMFTGQRRSDIVRFGKQYAKGGKLTFTQHKGRKRKPKTLVLPILPSLQSIIDASPCGDLTFLVNDLDRPFTLLALATSFANGVIKPGFSTVPRTAYVRLVQRLRRTTVQRRASSWRSSGGILSEWQSCIHAVRINSGLPTMQCI